MADENTQLANIVQLHSDIQPQDVEVLSVDQLEIMSMAELQEEKNKLEQRRNAVLLKLDMERLIQAEKIINRMDYALDRMIGYYDEEGNLVDISAMDFKLLTDGYKNLMNAYNMVTRLDSVNSSGTASRLSLRFEMPDGTLRGQIEYNG